MRVLVSAASKHGATDAIATAIADRLREAGLDVSLLAPDDVASIDAYDAVVLGSAIYAGRWLDPAKKLIDRNREHLATRPVWLFSSGPIGDPPGPAGEPAEAATMTEKAGARQHRVFAGRLDKADLGFGERLIVGALKAPEGDFRDWEAIAAWADEIAASLLGKPVAVAG